MANLELKLDPKRMKSKKDAEELQKIIRELLNFKIKLNLRLFQDIKLQRLNQELKPNFQKLRPQDEILKVKQETYKLSPINTTPKLSPMVQMQSTEMASKLQHAIKKHQIKLKKKLLREQLAIKEVQDKIANNINHQLR